MTCGHRNSWCFTQPNFLDLRFCIEEKLDVLDDIVILLPLIADRLEELRELLPTLIRLGERLSRPISLRLAVGFIL